jgi:SAM-dependent methyltransferase
MGLWDDQLLPRFIDLAMGQKALRPWREQAAEGLSGRIVEIGFGSGTNIGCYPPEVEVVLAVEPSLTARRLAARRVAASAARIEFAGFDGEALELEDASCDGALSTFTLCTVPEPLRALAELKRVLKPSGQLRVLEHGLAPRAKTARWQHRLDGLEARLCGGCHLTRNVPALLAEAGFTVSIREQRFAPGPRPWSWFTVATARPI